MKKSILLILYLIFNLSLLFIFNIKWEDFVIIQSLVPQRPFYIMLAIMQNLFYIFLMYNFVYQYQLCANNIIPRIGNKKFRNIIVTKYFITISVIFLFNSALQLLLFYDINNCLNLINALLLGIIYIFVSNFDNKTDTILIIYLAIILISKYIITLFI